MINWIRQRRIDIGIWCLSVFFPYWSIFLEDENAIEDTAVYAIVMATSEDRLEMFSLRKRMVNHSV